MDGIPFEFLAPGIPLPVLQARAGDRALRVVLDTGAVGPFPVYLSEATATALGMQLSAPVTPAQSTAVGPVRASYRTGKIRDFQLGPLALRDAFVSVTDVVDRLSAATGHMVQAIVGYDLVKARRVSLDYTTRRIDFDASPGPSGAGLPLQVGPLRPITLVQARINGKGPFTLEIDTGATASSVSPAAARRAGIRSLGKGRLTGAGGQVTVKVGQAELSFGTVTRALPAVNITGEIDRIGRHSGVALDGVLGADFLAGTRLTLDYPARTAWIEEALQK